MRTVLFICTGNTCRSPMAEAIARHYLDTAKNEGLDDLFVASAGIWATDGAPVASETRQTLRSLGIDHIGASKRLTAEMIRKADVVFGMTGSHVAAARDLVADNPDAMSKIVPLDPGADIEDPIGLGQKAYDDLAARLRQIIPLRLQELLTT